MTGGDRGRGDEVAATPAPVPLGSDADVLVEWAGRVVGREEDRLLEAHAIEVYGRLRRLVEHMPANAATDPRTRAALTAITDRAADLAAHVPRNCP